jgi:hypothetical protein
MNKKNLMNKIYLIVLLIVCACTPNESNEIPNELQDLKNLTVYSNNEKSQKTISFKQTTVYRSTDEVLIGRMQDVAIDSSGRVFIADILNQSIYVFKPDGTFLVQVGREGKGPSEFSTLKSLQIHRNLLHVYDPSQFKISIFRLDDFVMEKTTLLAGNRENYEELQRANPWINNLHVRNDQSYLAEFMLNPVSKNIEPWQNIELKLLFYPLDKNGLIVTDRLFSFEETHTVAGGLIDNIKVLFGSVMTAFSNNDNIYVSDSPNNLLIKIYSPNGDYLRAFYYPTPKIPITQESINNGGIANTHFRPDFLLKNLESIDLPQYWPVITDIKIDDFDRLWIATTVEDMSVYEWWVLKETGELITKFEWPRGEPIEVVRNGNIYTRKTDEETGLQQIVKYRFEINE